MSDGMQKFTESLGQLRNSSPDSAAAIDELEKFIETGKGPIKGKLPMTWAVAVRRVLSRPDKLTPFDIRGIEVLVQKFEYESIGSWLDKYLLTEGISDDLFGHVAEVLGKLGLEKKRIASVAARAVNLESMGRLTSAGRYLLGLDQPWIRSLLPLPDEALVRICSVLTQGGPDHHATVEMIVATIQDADAQMRVGLALAAANPEKYAESVGQNALSSMQKNMYQAEDLACRLLQQPRFDSVELFVKYIAKAASNAYETEVRQRVLSRVISQLGDKALKVLWAAAEEAEPAIQIMAIEQLLERPDAEACSERIEKVVLTGLANPKRAAKFAALAAGLKSPACIERLWELVAAKTKTVREAAAEALSRVHHVDVLDRAAGLGANPKKEARWGGALVLGALGTSAAVECLLHRLGVERDDDVRDEIVKGLRKAAISTGRIVQAMGPLNLEEVRQKAAALKEIGPKWLADGLCTPLAQTGGGTMERELVRYILYRQARQSDPVPDYEAAPLYHLIDRQHSGDFAHKLLQAFFDAEAGKADAWVLIVAGILGDNRALTSIATKVRSWATTNDQKLAAWGVAALAENGSDTALMAVRSIAEKFKDSPKRKLALVAEAAQNALELAAKRMGLSMDEMGDRAVPSLGFEPGRPRLIETEGRTIEATIGLDFKLAMKDTKTGKKAVSIPKSAPADVQAEFKGLGKLLQEVAKSQSVRLERLMVAQHSWSASRWRELFLQQAVLFPFAVRLVWAATDAGGNGLHTFRTIPDRTLTDAADEPFELADDRRVRIVHPLDLPTETISAWRDHLQDYEIEPPFLQMDRPVVLVKPDEANEMMCPRVDGVSLNALSFRSKAERSGWTRGPVVEGGMIMSYRRRFDSARIDAFVLIDGLPAYSDPTAMTKLGQVLFLPIDTKPHEFKSRQIPLGMVPKMVFSESVGDLTRICGRSDSGETDPGQAPTTSQTV